MLKHVSALVITCAFISGCASVSTPSGQVRIDSSSQDAAQASYQAMMKGRSISEQQRLAIAVLMLNMEGVKSAYDMVGNPDLQSPSIGRIKDKVAGLTADEIVALAARTSNVRIEAPKQ